MISLHSKVVAREGVLFRDLDGEAVLLSQATGRYYSLDEVGSRMWALLVEHGEVGRVCQALADEYDADQEQLLGDLTGFVGELVSRGLLRVHGE